MTPDERLRMAGALTFRVVVAACWAVVTVVGTILVAYVVFFMTCIALTD